MKLILTLLFQWFFICQGQVGRAVSTSNVAYKNFYSTIKKQFGRIDSLFDSDDYEFPERENQKIISILNQYKAEMFSFPDRSDYDLIYLNKSGDKNLILVSWDTRIGGAEMEFRTMAVYKTAFGIKTQMLVDSSNSLAPLKYMHYNSIHTLTPSKGNKIYLAWGNGMGSTAIPWQEVRAFSISNGQLIQPNVFPGEEPKLYIDFDLHDFKENETVPVIKIISKGRTVLVPTAGKTKGFSGKYDVYRYDGEVFAKNELPAYHKLKDL
jgi:hypothetical protein